MLHDIRADRPLKLDLGAGGPSGRQGFYSVDMLPLEGVDIAADLNQPLDELPDNSVGEICTRHALEHIANLLGLMAEIHRVTRPGGRIEITVPHFSNAYGFSDPTHVRFFGLYSMYYFVDPENQPPRKVPAFYSPARFRVESILLDFYYDDFLDRLLTPLVRRLVNRSLRWQEFYERRLSSLFHAAEITYAMRPVK